VTANSDGLLINDDESYTPTKLSLSPLQQNPPKVMTQFRINRSSINLGAGLVGDKTKQDLSGRGNHTTSFTTNNNNGLLTYKYTLVIQFMSIK
jgi:hypothetical protein